MVRAIKNGSIAMKFVFAIVAFAFLCASSALADIPPPYEPYGIGAGLEAAEPFPRLAGVQHGGPADKAGLKNGDGVIAIDGSYAKGGAPFYFFARGLRGPKDSAVELVVLRDGHSVLVVKVQRTVPSR